MAEVVVVNLEVNSDKAEQGVGTLRQQLKLAINDAQQMADKFGETSKQAIDAAKKAANLKEQIADINDTINALSPEAKFNAVVGVAQGIAGGFAAAQGAMALFGAESENVQKALLKVQAAMAVAQGLNDIKGLSDGFKNLGIVIRSSTAYTKLAAIAQAAYTAVVGASSGAMKTFRLALISTGLGALVVGLGTAVAYWKELNAWVEKNSVTLIKWGKIILSAISPPILVFNLLSKGVDFLAERFDFVRRITEQVGNQFSWLGAKIRELLEQVGVLDTKEEKAAEKRVEESKVNEQIIQRKIALAKAQGAAETELAELEVQLARERFLAYDQYIKARQASGRTVTDEEKQQYLDLAQALKVSKLEQEKTNRDADKKAQDERDKAYKKYLADEKKKNEEAKKIQQDLIDAQIAGIENERLREETLLNESFNRRIAAITGQSKAEIELRKQLEQNKQNELAALNLKFNEEDRAAQAAKLQLDYENQQALLDAQKIQAEIKKQETDAIDKEKAKLELDQALLDENLSREQKLLAQAQYDAKLNELDEKSKAKQIENEQKLREAKTSIIAGTFSALGSLNEIAIADQKKQEKVRKALALVQIGIDTATALGSALATANAPTPDNVASGGIAGVAKYITIAASVLGNAAKAKSLLGGGGGGGPSTPSVSSSSANISTASPRTNIPQVDLRSQQGNQFNQPLEFNIKANVIETDVTKTQKKVSDIEQNATF